MVSEARKLMIAITSTSDRPVTDPGGTMGDLPGTNRGGGGAGRSLMIAGSIWSTVS